MSGLIERLVAFRTTLDEFVAPVAAAKFVADLDDEGKADLDAWLQEQAVALLTVRLAEMDRHERTLARTRSATRAFADAAAAAERGEEAPLAAFSTFYVVDDDNLRRRVGEMTGADHRFVARRYQASSNRDALLAQFHVAIARKVGSKVTSEVMDEGTYLTLLASITSPTEAPGSRAKAA